MCSPSYFHMLYSLGWPWTFALPASAFSMLGLRACTTILKKKKLCFKYISFTALHSAYVCTLVIIKLCLQKERTLNCLLDWSLAFKILRYEVYGTFSFALGPAPVTKGIAKLLTGPQHRLHTELEECPCRGGIACLMSVCNWKTEAAWWWRG